MLSYVVKPKKDRKSWILQGIVLSAAALILGLSGLRYLAGLYLPMLLAAIWMLIAETEPEENAKCEQKPAQDAVITCEAFIRIYKEQWHRTEGHSPGQKKCLPSLLIPPEGFPVLAWCIAGDLSEMFSEVALGSKPQIGSDFAVGII